MFAHHFISCNYHTFLKDYVTCTFYSTFGCILLCLQQEREHLNQSLYSYFKTVWPCIMMDSLWIKPTDELSSNFIDIMTLHVSDSLSAHHQEFLAVHQHWYNLCSLVTGYYQMQDGTPTRGSTWSPNCINCTNADIRLRTLDDGQKDCLKHVEL
jgi:hypothetical protein